MEVTKKVEENPFEDPQPVHEEPVKSMQAEAPVEAPVEAPAEEDDLSDDSDLLCVCLKQSLSTVHLI